jgi:hypothetical protein
MVLISENIYGFMDTSFICLIISNYLEGSQ